MHVRPRDAGLHGIHHAPQGVEHGFVHVPLLLRKGPVDGEAGGDVGGIAVVLGAHVVEHGGAVVEAVAVGLSCVPVVQGGAARAGGADRGVGEVPGGAQGVGKVPEERLHLELVHAGHRCSHHAHVGQRRDAVQAPHEGHLPLRLVHALGAQDLVGGALVHVERLAPRQRVCRPPAARHCGPGKGVAARAERTQGELGTAVRVDAVHHVDHRRLCRPHHFLEFIHEVHLVRAIQLGVMLRRWPGLGRVTGPPPSEGQRQRHRGRTVDLTHPNGKCLGQPGDEQGPRPRAEIDGGQCVRLLHAKEVLVVALLAKEGLHVCGAPSRR